MTKPATYQVHFVMNDDPASATSNAAMAGMANGASIQNTTIRLISHSIAFGSPPSNPDWRQATFCRTICMLETCWRVDCTLLAANS